MEARRRIRSNAEQLNRDRYGEPTNEMEDGMCDGFPGFSITREESDFGNAMRRRMLKLGRFLTDAEVLAEAKRLGYATPAEQGRDQV